MRAAGTSPEILENPVVAGFYRNFQGKAKNARHSLHGSAPEGTRATVPGFQVLAVLAQPVEGDPVMSLFESIKKPIFYNPMAKGTASQPPASSTHAARPDTPASTTRPATPGSAAPQAKAPAQP